MAISDPKPLTTDSVSEPDIHTMSNGTLLTPDTSANPETEPETPGTAPSAQIGTTRRRIIMLSLCLTLFLSALDVTIVATALPTMARHLGADSASYAWIGSGYTLANTSSIAIWARLSDIFGRRPIIIASNVAFLAGSVVSGAAATVGMLIAGRVVQGLGGGGCTILITIIISDLFELRERAKYYGLTGIVYAISSSIGPVLGGVFTQTIGWRWCFWINLPFSALSLVVLFFILHVHNPRTPLLSGLRTLDWTGSALIVGGTIAFLYGLEHASGTGDWSSAATICLLVFGVLLLALFVYYEHAWASHPLVPTRIFSALTNIASIATVVLHSFIFIAYDYFLPLYFQLCLGLSPIISGVSLFALVLPLSAATMSAGWYVRRSGGDYLLPTYAGAVLMALGTGLLVDLGPERNWPKIILYQVLVGLGAGPLFQAPMIALQAHVAQADVAAASSASGFLRSLASSMSIVIGTVLLQRSLGEGRSITDATGTITPGEYAGAMRLMWIFYVAVAGVMLVVTVFIKKMPPQKGDAAEGEVEGDVAQGCEKGDLRLARAMSGTAPNVA